MRFVEVVVVFLVAFLDMATTFANMNAFGTCAGENNMYLRSLCFAYGYNAVWMWLPLEFSVLLLVYYCLKKLRMILSSWLKIRILPIAEVLFLVMALAPAINNILVLVCRTSLNDFLSSLLAKIQNSVAPTTQRFIVSLNTYAY
jgi:hypothetical protein